VPHHHVGQEEARFVNYAVIFVIWLEIPILYDKRFGYYIRLKKQFIDGEGLAS
jgi:hypothetical protein